MKRRLRAAALGALGALAASLAAPALGQPVKMRPGLWEHTHTMTSQTGRYEQGMAEMQRQMANMPPDQRRMISPMGSAGGASPGYYQRNMSWTGPDLGYVPVLPPSVPYVVYVEQPYYQRQPEPPPVVVVNTVQTPYSIVGAGNSTASNVTITIFWTVPGSTSSNAYTTTAMILEPQS